MGETLKDEPFVGRELTTEDIQLIAANNDLGLLASRCHILPDFVASAQFLVDLGRESTWSRLSLSKHLPRFQTALLDLRSGEA